MLITLDNFITNNIHSIILLNVIYRVEFNSFLVSCIINEHGMCLYIDKYYNEMAGKKTPDILSSVTANVCFLCHNFDITVQNGVYHERH